MDAKEESVIYRLTLFDFPKTDAVATIRHFGPGERMRRALKWGGALFGLAVVSVFLPIAHFVLVPGFLIAAIVFFARRLGQARKIEKVVGRCPRCGLEQEFELERVPLEGEIELTCQSCRNRIRGERIEDAADAGAPVARAGR
jgi:hypothetical protein